MYFRGLSFEWRKSHGEKLMGITLFCRDIDSCQCTWCDYDGLWKGRSLPIVVTRMGCRNRFHESTNKEELSSTTQARPMITIAMTIANSQQTTSNQRQQRLWPLLLLPLLPKHSWQRLESRASEGGGGDCFPSLIWSSHAALDEARFGCFAQCLRRGGTDSDLAELGVAYPIFTLVTCNFVFFLRPWTGMF